MRIQARSRATGCSEDLETGEPVSKTFGTSSVVFGVVSLVLMAAIACGESEPEGPPTFTEYPPMTVETDRVYTAILSTRLGRMTFELLPEEAPLAVNSFLFLASVGYYDNLTFHRILPGVLAETGDATGTGRGNAGYTFEIESPKRPYARGMLALANDGSTNSNGSRFFIILGDVTTNADLLPGFTVIGVMKESHAPSERTLEALDAVPVAPGLNGERSKPQEELTVTSVETIKQCEQKFAYAACT